MQRTLSMRATLSACFAGGLMLSGAVLAAGAAQPKPADVLATYGDIAHAMYEDSFTAGKALQTSVAAFLADPTAAKLAAARGEFLAARRRPDRLCRDLLRHDVGR